MIELELPCCGETTRHAELANEMRCESCCVVVELSADPVVAHDLPAICLVPALAA